MFRMKATFAVELRKPLQTNPRESRKISVALSVPINKEFTERNSTRVNVDIMQTGHDEYPLIARG